MAYPIAEGEREGERRILWDAGIDISASAGQVFTQELFHKTGLTAYNRKRFLACEPTIRLDWTAPGGGGAPVSGGSGGGVGGCGAPAYLVFAAVQVPLRGHKYFDRFPDPLNPQAVEHFIRITHERYAEELGPDLAGRIKGIFTDEVHPIGFEGAGIPWSPRMPEL
jgi:hypothetical protein